MRIRTCFFAMLLTIPGLSFGQELNRGSAHNQAKQQIAALPESEIRINKDVTLDLNLSEPIQDTMLIDQKDIAGLPDFMKKEALTPLKYKPVPLIGKIQYFGNHNNDYLITYAKSYANNFGRGLASVKNKKSTFQVIEGILDQHNIPDELKYLAVIESALNAQARSPVGAVGYWQFMDFTGRRMGLVINGRRDERTNLVKSTQAAAKFLAYLYAKFDDWLLVVGAYNCGAGRMEQAIRSAGGQRNFWAVKRFLPKETQNHVLAFVATATLMERMDQYLVSGVPENFNWNTLNYDDSPEGTIRKREAYLDQHPLIKRFGPTEVNKMALVKIDKPLKLEVLATVLGMDINVVNRWNYDFYDFQQSYKKGDTYNLRIPKDKLDLFLVQRNKIQKASNQ